MDDFARVKEAIDLVDVVSRYVPLRRKGARMVGLCPFHRDTNPSFGIPLGQKYFKCFVCGKGGDVFVFVAEMERIDKIEALRRLAEEAGIRLSGGWSEKSELRERLLRVLADAQDLFRRALASEVGAAARRLIESRKLRPETVDAFGIGYAPVAPGSGFGSAVIANRLITAGHRREDVIVAGVAGESDAARDPERGPEIYDFLRDRLTIPIRDERGRVIAFGGRRMSDGEGAPPAKYVNSRESPVFSKSYVLYGLDRARQEILKEERVVLVEGYMDVILAHQGGLTTAVAALGTAVTEHHAKHLRQIAPEEAVLFLDGDDAGKRAAERAAPILMAAGFKRTRVLVLKEDKDPGDLFARGATREEFERLLARDGVASIDFLLERHGLRRARSFEERMGVARAVGEALAPLADPLARKGALAHVARELDLPVDALLAALGRAPPPRRAMADARSASASPEGAPAGEGAAAPDPAAAGPPTGDGKVPLAEARRQVAPKAQVVAEQELLIAMLSDSALREMARKVVPEGTVVDPVRSRLFRALVADPSADGKQLVEGLLAEYSGEPDALQTLLDLVSRRASADTAGRLFDGAIRWFERRRHAQQRDQIREDHRPRMNSGDASAAIDFLRDYERLRRTRGAG